MSGTLWLLWSCRHWVILVTVTRVTVIAGTVTPVTVIAGTVTRVAVIPGTATVGSRNVLLVEGCYPESFAV